MASSTPNNTSTARQALLHTINERERELGRIRDAAEKIIEEEQRSSTQQLQIMQSQLKGHQKVLQEKDEYIHKLCHQIKNLEREFQEHEFLMKERSKDEIERRVEKIQSQLEKEYSTTSKENEARERKRLQMEFEEKLVSCEKKFHSEYQSTLLLELKKQEESLWSNFDNIIAEKQRRQEHVEKDLRDTIRVRDMDIVDLKRQYESQCEFSQTKLLGDLNFQKDRYEKITHDMNETNNMLNLEKEKVQDMYQCTQEKLHVVEKEAAYAKNQVQQLLDVLHNAEQKFVHRVQEFQYVESNKDDEIASLLNKVEKLDAFLIESKTNHKRDLKQLIKSFTVERKSLQRKIAALKSQVSSVNEDNVKAMESTKATSEQKDSRIFQMTQELENMRNDCKKKEDQIIRMEKESYQIQRELELKCEDVAGFKMNIQELQAKLKQEKSTFDDRLRNVEKERDDSNHNMRKEIMDLKLQNHASRSNAEMETASSKDLRIENKRLQLSLDEAKGENASLKETIKEMRKELENLISSTTKQSITPDCQIEDVLSTFNSIYDQLKHTIRNYDDRAIDNFREVLSRLGILVGPSVPEGKIGSLHSQQIIQELEQSCRELSSELQIVTKERNNLIDLSNQLKCDLSRLSRNEDEKYSRVSEQGQSSIDYEFAASDDINVDDLARSLWSGAIQDVTKENKFPLRASDRTTTSQRISLRNMQRGKERKLEQTKSMQSKIRARNWNNKDDIERKNTI